MNKQVSGDGTVGKAMDILDAVAAYGRPVRFAELLSDSTLPKATLYRLVQALANQGMLAFDPETHTYSPGLRLVRLAHSAWRQSSLAPVARPFVDSLAEAVGETIHLAQMDGGQVLYVDKRNASDPIEMFSQAGKVGPGYCTGVGKAIMAFQEPDIREQSIQRQAYLKHTPTTLVTADMLRSELAVIRSEGFAFDREEHEPGIICIAAPILSSKRRPIGAISVTTSTERHTLEGLDQFRPALLNATQTIAEAAENWQFPA